MIVVVPAATPVTTPVVDPIFTLALLLLHVPPMLPSVSVIVKPTHTVDGPSIVDGYGLTVTVVVTIHPDGGT